MVEEPEEQWSPEYLTILRERGGDRDILTPIQDRRFNECPTSALSTGEGPVIRQAVLAVLEAEIVYESTGCFPGGPDSSKWPAKWFDFVAAAGREKALVKHERDELADTASRIGV